MSAGLATWLVDRGLVPLAALRSGIRRRIRARLESLGGTPAGRAAAKSAFVAALRASPVTVHADAANRQHYEVPADFFGLVLGPHRKYSSGLWLPGATTLDEAEASMLAATAERAGLADGQRVLDLGCGWGSLTLWAAERFPASTFLAVSNSLSQREHVVAEAARRGLGNVEVRTADVADFDPPERFDRVVSVEMFEHVRNWEVLLARVRRWLLPGGRVFLHVFSHREVPYAFEPAGPGDWMARWFFTGGIMPSADLLDHLETPFEVERRWDVPGTHYERTARAWRERLEARRREAISVLARAPGEGDAKRAWRRWRTFFLACEVLFGWDGGREWGVTHVRLRPRGESAP